MKPPEIHQCQCGICQKEVGDPKEEEHRLMNVFMSCLNEQERHGMRRLKPKS